MISRKSLYVFVALLAYSMTAGVASVSVSGIETRKQDVPLLVLESSSSIVKNFGSNSALARAPQNPESLYTLDSTLGEISIYNRGNRMLKKRLPFASGVESFTVDSQGNMYLVKRNAEIQVIDSDGNYRDSFLFPHANSLGVLTNGNVVIATPFAGKLLHIYSRKGRLINSFGDVKNFDFSNPRQNDFLNSGKVVVGREDEIYFISKYAPVPYVLKFSANGLLISEFIVSGNAIDFQLEKAKDFLQKKRIDQVGGFTVVTSAAIHPMTGHLWIAMNGLSTTGNIYEYGKAGTKIREYAFIVKPPLKELFNVTHLKDIALSASSVSILTWGGTYDFLLTDIIASGLTSEVSLKKEKEKSSRYLNLKYLFGEKSLPFFHFSSFANPLIQQGARCGQPQNYSCDADCASASTPTSVDCDNEVSTRIRVDDVITSSDCNRKPIYATPGSTSPGGCKITAQICNKGTGNTGSLTFEVNCNAVPTPIPTPDPEPEPTPTPSGEIGGGCELGYCSPIVIDVSGNGFNLTNATRGVRFDLDNDSVTEQLSWTSVNSDDAWLALDRNGNGTIDSGRELFGNFTPQQEPPPGEERHGFRALAKFDKPQQGGNSDGWIDARDAIFSSLRLWQDQNHNGISEPGELHTLSSKGITRLDLDYQESKRVDAHGNQFKYRAKVRDEQGAQVGRWAWDVFLVAAQ